MSNIFSGRPFLSRGSWEESRRVAEILRKETVGGVLLLIGALAALIWANTTWSDSYHTLRETTVGPAGLHLDLSLGAWAADGLLAVFFFVVGVELKREFVEGSLRDLRRAAMPVTAALGGMAVPALIFVTVNLRGGAEALNGWAVPTATDIAFAVAILAVIGSHLPSALRTFLLTLAVVDDLLAVTVIAVFYTDELNLLYLGAALVPLLAFGITLRRGGGRWWLLVPLAGLTWWLVHESGVHATIAGVLLGFAVPVTRRVGDSSVAVAEHIEHRVRPLSAGFAVPVFAFFAAGVTVGGLSGLSDALTDPISLGVIAGLVLGKVAGILGVSYLVARFTRARLDDELRWVDVLGVSLLGGIGFTVSLLIGDLAYGAGTVAADHVKVAVLCGSLLSAALASIVLTSRNRTYRQIRAAELEDEDGDGIPDVYQQR
ncbi:Na+/H+ antiporter NhaA [Rhodococcus pyridinivorans]|uniref:Na+/H+ antiporter NhaA n=1 Tax=Rhodococcus pyridinivorans TaxID=103816 RepID=UPI001E5B2EDB|nr:Na+/H+ antiporter NhaA [Rhodococcus pyridinivorans]UGQ58527.1 Na+/H+ antiporter NhaA [Rhodococcus pyridinivorans]